MGFFDKIKAGLAKTRDAMASTIGSVFSGFSELDDDFYDELEECLILADLGVDTAVKATDRLRKTVREQKIKTAPEAKTALKEILVEMLNVGSVELNLSTTPSVVLVIGVNGVGKTTTIGKIAMKLTREGKKVLLCAGDTFRAAAAEQLTVWADRAGCGIVRHCITNDGAGHKVTGLIGQRREFREEGISFCESLAVCVCSIISNLIDELAALLSNSLFFCLNLCYLLACLIELSNDSVCVLQYGVYLAVVVSCPELQRSGSLQKFTNTFGLFNTR